MITLRKDPFGSMIDLFFETPSYYRGIVKRTNIVENDDDYRIQLAVPGLSKEDIKIVVKHDVISISHENTKTDDNTFFFTDSFKKEYYLPEDSDEKNITGKVDNGILEIIISKSKKKSNERTITIN
jgi:HSP20 family protein